jgi:cytochrome b561
MSRANNDTYTRFAIIMHWSSVFLILLNLSIGLYMDTFPHNSPRSNGILFYHVYLGWGARAAVMYSLIGSARLNGFDPEAYIPRRPQRGV